MEKLKNIMPYLFGGLVLLIVLSINKIRLWFEKKRAVFDTINNSQKVEIQGSSVTIDLDTIAAQIYDCFYQPDGDRRWNEDEKRAVEWVAKCPQSLISSLSVVYANKYGHILKDDLISKLRSSQWKSIEYLFN